MQDELPMETPVEPESHQDAVAEMQFIESIVARYFPVYEAKLNHDSVAFKCRVDPEMLEETFQRLREELGKSGYTPVITYRAGEHTIAVGKLPPSKPRSIWVNVAMLLITIVTTIVAGIILWKGYMGETTGPFFTANSVFMGALTFALPLMGILAIHEMGHYLMARHHGVPASLPFFIPAPPPLPLGTFGAFISIRAPMPDRKTLFDLGVSGPIAGFIVTIPVAIIGLMLTSADARPIPEETGGVLMMMSPLMYDLIGMLLPMPGEYLLHPTAFAAWVGFLVTAINLLPAGSLDGGHIARAALGPNAKYVSWAAVIGLFILGWFYLGWMLFAVIILFLGISHAPPLNDITMLSSKRKLLGIGMITMLVVSFVPIPFLYEEPDYGFEASLQGVDEGNVSATLSHTFTLIINGTGNMNTTLKFALAPADNDELSFSLAFDRDSQRMSAAPPDEIMLPVNSSITAYFTVSLAKTISESSDINATINIFAEEDDRFERSIPVLIHEIAGSYSLSIEPEHATVSAGNSVELAVSVNSSSIMNITVELTVENIVLGWSAGLYIDDEQNATSSLSLPMEPLSNISCTLKLISPSSASVGEIVNMRIVGTSEQVPGERIIEFSVEIV